MGSSHSNTIASTESILTAVVVAAAAAGGYVLYHNAHSQPSTTSNKSKQKPKSLKRKGGKSQDLAASEAEKDAGAGSGPVVVPFPAVIPGDFGSASTAEESGPASSAGPEKRKKKKGKKAKKDVNTAPVGQTRAAGAFIETASEDDSEVDATPIPEPAPTPATTKASKSKSKKSKKAKAEGTATPQPTTATTTSSQTQQKAPSPSAFATHLAPPEEERWTRVESRGKGKKRNAAAGAGSVTGGESGAETGGQGKDLTASARTMSASDAGITTSVTGTGGSSVEDEAESQSGEEYVHFFFCTTLFRLIELILYCLLSASDVGPEPPSVLKVRPAPGEQPAKGFSWDDYEGVQVDSHNDASGEDDEGGWEAVKSKSRSSTFSFPSYLLPL